MSSGSLDPGVPPQADGLPLLQPGGCGAQYRELADNLRSLDGPPGRVAVTGVSERVGCSTVCLGLGGALASMGLRVAVVDCNFGSPRLHRMLGEPNFTGLTTALQEGCEPEGCAYEPVPDLLVMPTGPIPESPARSLETGDFGGLVGGLRRVRDVVLLDTPEYREMLEYPALAGGCDGALLVLHASRTPKSEAREASEALADAGVELLGVVFNGSP